MAWILKCTTSSHHVANKQPHPIDRERVKRANWQPHSNCKLIIMCMQCSGTHCTSERPVERNFFSFSECHARVVQLLGENCESTAHHDSHPAHAISLVCHSFLPRLIRFVYNFHWPYHKSFGLLLLLLLPILPSAVAIRMAKRRLGH